MGVVFFPSLPFMGVMLFPSFTLGNASEGGVTLLVPLSLFSILLSLPLFLFSFSFFFILSSSLSSFFPRLILPFLFLTHKLFPSPFSSSPLFPPLSFPSRSPSFSFSLPPFLIFFYVSFSLFLFLTHKLFPSLFSYSPLFHLFPFLLLPLLFF